MANHDRLFCLGLVQMSMVEDHRRNLARASELVRDAAGRGAQVVLLPELFETQYFPRLLREEYFELARAVEQSEAVGEMAALAKELGVVIPVSFFEKDGDCYYNSMAVLDEHGDCLGVYRKSHIPDGAGYEEKYYFTPGNTGFKVFGTRFGNIGVGICWDQWFPECARALTLLGADVLLYPTAIGSEPEYPEYATREAWRRAMRGHAASNGVVIAAANRVGQEGNIRFYGSSFIAGVKGDILAELGTDQQGVAIASVDLEQVKAYRKWLGVLTDRRPELYGILTHPVKK